MPNVKTVYTPGNVKMEKGFRVLIAGSNRDVHNNFMHLFITLTQTIRIGLVSGILWLLIGLVSAVSTALLALRL